MLWGGRPRAPQTPQLRERGPAPPHFKSASGLPIYWLSKGILFRNQLIGRLEPDLKCWGGWGGERPLHKNGEVWGSDDAPPQNTVSVYIFGSYDSRRKRQKKN